MLCKETVEKRTLDLIKLLMKDDIFMSFNLVGGTALALKLGHRNRLTSTFLLLQILTPPIFQSIYTLPTKPKEYKQLSTAYFVL